MFTVSSGWNPLNGINLIHFDLEVLQNLESKFELLNDTHLQQFASKVLAGLHCDVLVRQMNGVHGLLADHLFLGETFVYFDIFLVFVCCLHTFVDVQALAAVADFQEIVVDFLKILIHLQKIFTFQWAFHFKNRLKDFNCSKQKDLKSIKVEDQIKKKTF